MIKLLKKNILSLIIALVILYLSFAPAESLNKVDVFHIPHLDKIIHFAMYFTLTAALLYENRSVSKNAIIQFIIALLPFIYGVSIEFLQSFLTATRKGDIFDVVFNFIGVIMAVTAWKVFLGIKKKEN